MGLTPTPTRKDGHHPIIFMQCGGICSTESARDAVERSPFRHLVLPRYTSFGASSNLTSLTIHDAYAAMVVNAERNQQIITDVRDAVSPWSGLVGAFEPHGALQSLCRSIFSLERVLILKGGMGRKRLKETRNFQTRSSVYSSRTQRSSAKARQVNRIRQAGEDQRGRESGHHAL